MCPSALSFTGSGSFGKIRAFWVRKVDQLLGSSLLLSEIKGKFAPYYTGGRYNFDEATLTEGTIPVGQSQP